MNGIDDLIAPLAHYLAAWRGDSLQPALPESRERSRAAMLATVAGAARAGHRVRALPLRSGFRFRGARPRLASTLVAFAAAVAIGLLGWNAPAGSPLHGVRVARQSVQLVLPGADLVALHLQFAEQSLADARNGINPAASLADAKAELDVARGELPADHGSSLWTRWDDDESALATEDAALGKSSSASDGSSAEASPGPSGSRGESPEVATGAPGAAGRGPGSAVSSERPEASPSGTWGGGEDQSPPPTGSPHDS